MVGCVAAGITGDYHTVAGLERVLLDSLTAQLSGGVPLGDPENRLSLLIGNFHQDGGMRVAEQKLCNPAFNAYGLSRVGGGEGVMSPGVRSAKENCGDHHRPRGKFHPVQHSIIIARFVLIGTWTWSAGKIDFAKGIGRDGQI